ncbi:MAG: transcription elongation factor subunit Spt4 [Candidatus Micrarchaeota archaeon]
MTEKACRKCRIIVTGDVCPVCKDSELTKTWEGYIIIANAEGSEVAAAIGVKAPGKYALKIK